MSEERRIEVGTDADGSGVSLPVEQVLTGRSFLTGKSGAGKSNTVSVVIEKLLDAGYPVLIVDTDGEYYGLKEEYELLHAGADEECDIQVAPEHAERVAELALEENVPVILDVSGYLDGEEASDLIRETARHLFAKEKKLKMPFLLVIEEVHEYIPEGGGLDGTGRMLIKVGKRGRKHGLGIVGISQRPADVKKDFITQANWLVWHRLTWENDTNVVKRVVGSEYAEEVADLDDGEAFLQRDWTDGGVTRVQFDRKRTFDAGATPGLDEFERPDLKSVSDSLVDDLIDITDAKEREQDRVEKLEATLAEKNDRIAELQADLRAAKNVSRAAKRMADALTSGGTDSQPFGYERRLGQKNDRIEDLEAELDAQRATIDDLRDRLKTAGGHLSFEEYEGGEDAEAQFATSKDPDTVTGNGHGVEDDDPSENTGVSEGPSDPSDVSGDQSDCPGFDLSDLAGADVGGDGIGNSPDAGGGAADLSDTGTEDSSDTGTGDLSDTGTGDLSDTGTGDLSDTKGRVDPISLLGDSVGGRGVDDDLIDQEMERLRRKGERLQADSAPVPAGADLDVGEMLNLLHAEPVVAAIDGARRDSLCNHESAWSIVAALAAQAPMRLDELARGVPVSTESTGSFLAELHTRSLVVRDEDRRYRLNPAEMRCLTDADGPENAPATEFARQWDA